MTTTSTLTQLTPTEVALEFTLSGDELAAAEERAFRRLSQNARLPGFRKGKVPRKIFEQAYGSEAITSQAVEDVVPEVYARAVREHDLDPVDRPKLEVIEHEAGRPSRFKATVEVRPAIELGRYKGIVVRRPPIEVTGEDVERSLQSLAKERATLVPADRPARAGDVATVDYAGTIEGIPFEGGQATGQTLELSEDRFVPGFVAGIAGMRPGEHKEIALAFPDDYPSAEVAGKPAVFSITLHELKEYELPPLDDEFAKAVSGCATLDELRSELRRRLEAIATARSRRLVGDAVLEQLVAAHDFALPASMVDAEVDRLVEDAAARGPVENEAALRASLRPAAESRVKNTLLVERIAKVENIVATPADISAELEVLARRYGQPAARIRKALGNNLLSLMDGIVRSKTLDLLVDNAEVVADQETLRSPS